LISSTEVLYSVLYKLCGKRSSGASSGDDSLGCKQGLITPSCKPSRTKSIYLPCQLPMIPGTCPRGSQSFRLFQPSNSASARPARSSRHLSLPSVALSDGGAAGMTCWVRYYTCILLSQTYLLRHSPCSTLRSVTYLNLSIHGFVYNFSVPRFFFSGHLLAVQSLEHTQQETYNRMYYTAYAPDLYFLKRL
jgi:hypothetical protein